VDLLKPSEEEIHSGIVGVPFKAQAKSYQKDWTEPYYIQKVEFSYSELGAPAPDDWILAGIDEDPDTDHKFTYRWYNSIDDSKVWIRARAIDDGYCESLYDKIWIKIDSTRPTVTRNP